MKFKGLFSITAIRLFLLVLSTALFAFTDSEFFRHNFDFQRLLYQYETLGPSKSYQNKMGIEVEGYYTEKRATDGSVSLTAYKDLVDIGRETLLANGYQPLRSQDLSKQQNKEQATGLFFSSLTEPTPTEKKLLFVSDPSIFFPDGRKPVEIVSPILENRQDVQAFYSLLDSLSNERYFTAEPLNSGTHFHFDFSNPSREEVLILTIVLEKLLPEIRTAFSVQDKRSSYFATAYSAVDFESLVGFTKSVASLRHTTKLNVHRHRATNWHALGRHGTFEFRLFNSTADSNLLSIQADLIGKIVKAVRLRDPNLLALLKTENLAGLTLDSVAKALDCLVAEPAMKAYAHTATQADVTRSKAIEHKLVAQQAYTVQRLLDSYLSPSSVASRVSALPRFSPSNQGAYSNTTFMIRPPTISTNLCIEFYK